MSHRVKVFVLLFTSIMLSNQQHLMASESAVALFPSLKKKAPNTNSNRSRGLNADAFTVNVYQAMNSWRALIEKQPNQSLKIELKTGDWGRKGSNNMSNVWVSYDKDWAPLSASGKTITYSYTFGESTIGISSAFRLIANENSRKADRQPQNRSSA